jgi:hypothetical protein
MPAQAGIRQPHCPGRRDRYWMPAFAGMTGKAGVMLQP